MKYDDIINLEKWEPKNHQRMSLSSRSALFAPFAALTGYKEEIIETCRITDVKREISDDEKMFINEKIKEMKNYLGKIKYQITYFIKDKLKKGGSYVTICDYVKKIDEVKKEIVMNNKEKILINNIIEIKNSD